MSEQPVHAKMLIAGKWENGQERFEVRNPANPSEVVGTVGRGMAVDAQRAIAVAKAAQPTWAITLELGGNDAAILLEDVDLSEDTMKRMAHGVLLQPVRSVWR